MNKRSFFNKKDILILFAVIIAALILLNLFRLFSDGEGSYVQIIHDGQVIKELPLDTDTAFTPDFNSSIIIEIKDGSAAFAHSDCPDKICIKTGKLSISGQTAVCLPNKLSIVVKSKKGNDVDAVL